MSSAEDPAPAAIGGEPKPESSATTAKTTKIARLGPTQANRLANLASGGATTFLIGGVAAVVLALFPLRLADRQWQLGVLANLVANGSWILIGLVLLHLASMLEPAIMVILGVVVGGILVAMYLPIFKLGQVF